MIRLPIPLPTLIVVLAACASAGCSSRPPVRVEPASMEEVRTDLERSALTGDAPSVQTQWILRLTESEELYEEDSEAALRWLHGVAAGGPTSRLEFALAELSYLAAKRTGKRSLYLAAAVYAYLFLLGDEAAGLPDPWDRRYRWACDLYNRSVAGAFRAEGAGRLVPEAGRYELPVGALHVEVDTAGFPFETGGLELLLADELEVVGLTFRVRDSGLGAPLVAVVKRRGEGSAGIGILDRTSVSATAFLRVEGGLAGMEHGLRARLELHATHEGASVTVGDHAVPLEADLSATVAHSIESADLWKFDLRNLFHGRDAARENGLILLQPFESSKIPVVLVHGTASNPAYWAELCNSLTADPAVRERFQFWFFIYTTGNPIAYSAATLREKLSELVERYDPDGENEALHRMVVVGHSQGGLLAKMTGITTDADKFVMEALGTSLEEMRLGEAQEALVRRCFDVEPLPFVERIVFVSTPHRGSFLASYWFARVLAKMIALPGEVVSTADAIFASVPSERLPRGMSPRVGTSLDNMNPKNRTLQLLSDVPVDPRIHTHSIVAIGRHGDPDRAEGANDGVVAYSSAHVEGAESEELVLSGHSCQSNPRTMLEIRRILREHVGIETQRVEPPPRAER